MIAREKIEEEAGRERQRREEGKDDWGIEEVEGKVKRELERSREGEGKGGMEERRIGGREKTKMGGKGSDGNREKGYS